MGGRRADAGLLPAAREGRMNNALHAEWTKVRTVTGPAWLLAGVVAATIAVGAATASATRCSSTECGIDPAKISFTGIYLGQAAVAVAGVLAIGNEYSTGMIGLSLTAVPRRLTLLIAKAMVLAVPVLIASALAVAGFRARRAADPPRPRLHPRARVRVPHRRRRPPGRRRRGPVPDADRPAQPRGRHCGTRLRGGHRTGTRLAVPVPDRRVPQLRRENRPAPAADRPPVGRPGRPGHDRGEEPAALPVAGPRRRRPLDRRRPPPRRTCLDIPRCMTPDTAWQRAPGPLTAGAAQRVTTPDS